MRRLMLELLLLLQHMLMMMKMMRVDIPWLLMTVEMLLREMMRLHRLIVRNHQHAEAKDNETPCAQSSGGTHEVLWKAC